MYSSARSSQTVAVCEYGWPRPKDTRTIAWRLGDHCVHRSTGSRHGKVRSRLPTVHTRPQRPGGGGYPKVSEIEAARMGGHRGRCRQPPSRPAHRPPAPRRRPTPPGRPGPAPKTLLEDRRRSEHIQADAIGSKDIRRHGGGSGDTLCRSAPSGIGECRPRQRLRRRPWCRHQSCGPPDTHPGSPSEWHRPLASW
jgi:hypothetical protein